MFASTANNKTPSDDGDSDSDDSHASEPVAPAIMLDSDSSEDKIVTSSAIHKTPKSIATVTPRKRKAVIIEDDTDSEYDVPTSLIKRRQVMEDSDGDSDVRSPGGDHFGKRIGTTRSASNSPPRITRQQNGKRKHRTEKEKQMELLKRRRAGEKNPELTESETEEDSDANVHLSDFEDEEEEEEEEQLPKPKPKRTHNKSKPRRNSDSLDDEESDWVVDDEEIGVPTAIPLEFTSGYNKPLREHFTDAVECYIHKKLNPGFTGKQDVFDRAFNKLDDKPMGLKNSKYGSSQWVPDFVKALDARPEYAEVRIAASDAEARCEACNMGGHIPTFRIVFTGKPYNKTTLEEVQQREDESQAPSDSEDDSETGSVDGQGRRLPPQDREWLVGKYVHHKYVFFFISQKAIIVRLVSCPPSYFYSWIRLTFIYRVCRNNAYKTHLLSHWRYHLYEWIIDNLEAEGELKAKKLVQREKMKPWKRQRYVEKVVARWEDDKKIENLYRDYKNSVEALVEEKQTGRWGSR